MSKKLKGAQPDDGTQEILRKLDEPSAKQNVKTVQGGVLIDMENADTYGKKDAHCLIKSYSTCTLPVCGSLMPLLIKTENRQGV